MSSSSRTPKSARLEQILLWYDGPQIALLNAGLARFVLGVAIEDADSDTTMIGALVTVQQLAAYQMERYDLRYLLTHPSYRRWFLFDIDDPNAEIALHVVDRHADLLHRSLPEAGFFSRAHDPISVVDRVIPTTTERFNIDGGWDLDEMSTFYNNVEDVYYTLNNMERFTDPLIPLAEKDELSENFVRPFEGGGSYLGFYRTIANDNDLGSTLRVSGIKYNSPGYVEVKARKEPFDALLKLIDIYADDPSRVREAYRDLYKFLSDNSLLKAPPESYLSTDTKSAITSLSKRLSEKLSGVEWKTLEAMAQSNILIAAKVLLSLVRRVEKLVKFFEQGRVVHAQVTADALNDM